MARAVSETLAMLREAVRQAEEGEVGDELHWFAARCLRRYLHARRFGCTFERAVGLEEDGGPPWWTAYAMQDRNAQIKALAGEHFGDLELTEQARAVAQAMNRYAVTGWRRDRARGGPSETSDDLRRRLFEVMRAAERTGRDVPSSDRQIRNLLKV